MSVIKIDGPAIRAALAAPKFQINETAGTYSAEYKTTGYHTNLFNAITKIEEFWQSCVENAGIYIENFDSVQLPKDFFDNSGL